MRRVLSFPVVVLMLLAFPADCRAQGQDAGAREGVKITLTIGVKIIPAVLYNTAPAKELLARLPVTVSLNRGPVDYCGGIDPIKHTEDDVQTGYHNGDLAYWVPGQDLVIFTKGEESSRNVSGLVVLGRISSDIEEIRELGSAIKVTIDLDG